MNASPFAMRLLPLLAAAATAVDVGILYEVWHTTAAQAMGKVAALGAEQLTTELVIASRAGPNATRRSLDDIYARHGLNADIYNAQPQLGYYCLYRARPGEVPPIPDCANISATARAHAAMLVSAGIDYVAIDVTNWPQQGTAGGTTDVSVLRPTEVLFEEWRALRDAGVPTPQIAVWPCSPAGGTTWRYLLATLYNNPRYADLVYTQNGKRVVFLPYAGPNCYDAGEEALIAANGGRNDVVTIRMWALFGREAAASGAWGFFAPCTEPSGAYTTSMVGVGPCNQDPTLVNGTTEVFEVTASGGYMTSQCALPFASPGHLRGLTIARLFERVLATRAPHLFISSFNEYIGGRQAPAYKAKVAFNMGLPDDSQRLSVWVDTYAAEFSRDLEPSVEGGNRTWLVAVACVQLYKAGQDCSDAPASLCCTRDDKEVFANAWSLARKDGGDHLVTALVGERNDLVAGGAWTERCSPVANPTAFCVDGAEPDGRDGPFMLYNTSAVPDYVAAADGSVALPTAPLYRCIRPAAGTHFLSARADCEGERLESVIGYMATRPGLEMLRALYRCAAAGAPSLSLHALDLPCDVPDPAAPAPLGYVR